MGLTLTIRTERWPIAGAFTIARGAKTESQVVVAGNLIKLEIWSPERYARIDAEGTDDIAGDPA